MLPLLTHNLEGNNFRMTPSDKVYYIYLLEKYWLNIEISYMPLKILFMT